MKQTILFFFLFLVGVLSVRGQACVPTCPTNLTLVAPDSDCERQVTLSPIPQPPSCTVTNSFNGTTNASGIYPIGETIVVYTATTGTGGTSTCSFSIIILDTKNPDIVCPGSINVPTLATGCSTFVNVPTPVAQDNCTIISLQNTFNNTSAGSDFYPLGTTTVTWIALDPSANGGLCLMNITVEDLITPAASCMDFDLVLDGFGSAVLDPNNINDGSSDNCSVASVVAFPTIFSCNELGPNTVELTVTDGSGNSSTCQSEVTIQYPAPPQSGCMDLTVYLDGNGNYFLDAFQLNDGTSEACGTSFSAFPNAFTCPDVGPNTVTFTVTDVNGMFSTCSSVVTVLDTVSPEVISSDTVLALDANGNLSISASHVDNGSNDACGLSSIAVNPSTFNFQNLGPNLVTLTATDQNGNTSSTTVNVLIIDNTPPTALCQDITIYLDNFGFASITPTSVDAGSFDPSGVGSVSLDIENFTCQDVGQNQVELSITDGSNNTGSCTSIVTVEDTIDPTIFAQDITLNLDTSGVIYLDPALIDNGSFDLCNIDSMWVDPSVFTSNELGDNNVVFTVLDGNGNTSSTTVVVTIADDLEPTANCRDISVNLDNNGFVSITPTSIDDGSYDPGGISSFAISNSDFTCVNIGPNSVVLSVTDGSGNASTCTSIVTVLDNSAPTINASNLVVFLDSNGVANVSESDVDQGSFDPCGIASSSLSQNVFDCQAIGNYNVTYTVTDINGNSSNTNLIITVMDSFPLVANCEPVVTLELDPVINFATVSVSDIDNGSFDNCGLDSMNVFPEVLFPSNQGPNTVVLTVFGASGQNDTCHSIVNVEVPAPEAYCYSQPQTAYLNPNGLLYIDPMLIDSASTAAAGIANISVDPALFSCGNIGLNSVVLTVTDVNNRDVTCTSMVTIMDTVSPLALCKDITVPLDSTGVAHITSSMVNNGSEDACGILSPIISQADFNQNFLGVNNVTLTITDQNGNVSTCNSVVTVVDDAGPILNVTDAIFPLGHNGTLVVLPSYIDLGSFDPLGIMSISLSIDTFTCSEIGSNDVVVTAVDSSGNISTDSIIITIVDVSPPDAICQDAIVELNPLCLAEVIPLDIDGGSYDGCGIQNMQVSPAVFTCVDAGINQVQLTVTDFAGNTSTCMANVIIADSAGPDALCQDLTVTLGPLGYIVVQASDIDNGSTHLNGIGSLTLTQDTFSCADIGVNLVTLSVVSNSGSVSGCQAMVTVLDPIGPTALCANASVSLDSLCMLNLEGDEIDNGSTDDCGIETYTISPPGFLCSDIGPNIVVMTVTDFGGNTSSCSAVLNLVDNFPPTVITQTVTITLDPTGVATINAQDVNGGSFDAAGIANMYVSQNVFTCNNIGPNDVILTVIDVNGNSSNGVANVIVVDADPPLAICQDLDVIINPLSCISIITGAMVNDGSTDLCGISSYNVIPNTFTGADFGPNLVTLTVTDNGGNIGICQSVVNVEVNVAPSAVCKNVTLLLDSTGNHIVQPSEIDNGSIDACGAASMVVFPNSFTCPDIGPNDVVLSITDHMNNTSSCSSTITIIDAVPPNAICKDFVLNLDGTGNGTLLGGDLNNGSNDACGIFSMIPQPNLFDCSNIGANTVELEVTDNNGNTSTCSSVVTLVDNQIQSADCQDFTLSLDSTGNATLLPSNVAVDDVDACGTNSSVNPPVFNITSLGPNSVVLTVVDANGLQTTCSATVTVVDDLGPNTVCNNMTVLLDSFGMVVLDPADFDGGASDPSGVAGSVINPTTLDCINYGDNQVTVTFTDNLGNTSSCISIVNVAMDILPQAICTVGSVSLDANCNAIIDPSVLEGGSYSPCYFADLISDPATFDCTNLGFNSVELTVVDLAGNTSTCQTSVEVLPYIVPTALCKNTTIALGPGGAYNVTFSDIDNGSNSSNGLASLIPLPSSLDCSNLGPNIVELVVTNTSGNTSSCTSVVTVLDVTAPSADCGLIDVQIGQNGVGVADGALMGVNSYDACGIAFYDVSPSQFGCGTMGIHNVVLTVSDSSGNSSTCSGMVNVVDNMGPEAHALDLTLILDANGQVSMTTSDLNGGSTAPCGISTMNIDISSFDCSNIGDNSVVLMVEDGNGLSSSDTGNVTIVDNIPPVAVCGSYNASIDQNGIAVLDAMQLDNGSTDVCGISSYSVQPESLSIGNLGANSVELTITDFGGNVATCSTLVFVTDLQQPQMLCNDLVLELNSFGLLNINPLDVDGGSTDPGGISSFSLSQSGFNCSHIGVNQVILTATDNFGNSSSCQSNISISDNTAPAISCKDASLFLDPNGTASLTPPQINGGTSDACGLISIVASQLSFSCTDLGANLVTLTATDNHFNVSTCIATVNVYDLVSPIALCQDLNMVLTDSGSLILDPNLIDGGSSDNCGVASFGLNPPLLDANNVGANDVVLEVTDGSGNFSTCTSIISISPPLISPTYEINPEDCKGYENGSAKITLIGGQEPYDILWSTGQTGDSIGNLAPGIYSVEVTDANSFQMFDTIYVDSLGYPVPDPILVPGDLDYNLCFGDTLFLKTGDAYAAYEWNTGSTSENLNIVSSGDFWVTVYNGFGCYATTSTISIHSLPEWKPIIIYQSGFLIASGGTTYQWFLEGEAIPEAIDGMYEAWVPGIYSVETFDQYGCLTRSEDFHFLGTSTEAGKPELSFKVYPNPASDKLFVEGNLPHQEEVSIEIINQLGQVIWVSESQNLFGSFKNEIKLDNYSEGVYLLRINYGETNSVKRFIIEK